MITILSHFLLPMAHGEEPGMPTYRVYGKILHAEEMVYFTIDVSCEIDGREVEFANAHGPGDFADNYETHGQVFDAMCQSESWLALHKVQCDAFYNS